MIGGMRIVNAILSAVLAVACALGLAKSIGDIWTFVGACVGAALVLAPYIFVVWALGPSPASSRFSLIARIGMGLHVIGLVAYVVFTDKPLADRLVSFAFFATLIVLNWIALSKRKSQVAEAPPQPDLAVESTREYRPGISYFARHWNGDYSLAISYWVNLVLITNLAPFAALKLLDYLSEGDSFSLRTVSVLMLITYAFGLVAWIWGITGTWRSANKHKSRGGAAGWAVAAKVFMVLGILSSLGRVSTNSFPMMREYALLAIGQDPIGSYKVSVLSGGKSVLVQGTLREGSAEQISQLLAANPNADTLVLSSRGGRLGEAKALGRVVREQGLNTYVEDLCASACTFVFLAGKDRAATRTAKIGFHAAAFPGMPDDSGMSRYAAQVYRAAGLPEAFIARALRVPNNDMWYPSVDELRSAGVITRTSYGGETTLVFSSIKSREALEKMILGIPLFQAIGKRYPDVLDRAIASGWDAKQAGGNDEKVMQAMRKTIAEAHGRLLKDGDDRTLDEFAALIVWQAKAVRKIGYPACSKFLATELNLQAVLPAEYGEREQKWLIDNLSRPLYPPQRRSQQEIQRALQTLVASLPKSHVSVISNLAAYKGQPLECDATISLYENALNLPPATRSAAFEGMFKQ